MALLNDKHALVVGASSGIGRGIALRLAREGANVVVAARREETGKAVVEEIKASGGNATFIFADVTDSQSVLALVQSATNAFGAIDVAVNNAGIGGTPFTPTADYDEAVFDAVIDTNLKGVWRCMKYELPVMAEGGVIINMYCRENV